MASTNRTDNCLVGPESEYDYQGDGWEDYRSCPSLKFGLEDEVYARCHST